METVAVEESRGVAYLRLTVYTASTRNHVAFYDIQQPTVQLVS